MKIILILLLLSCTIAAENYPGKKKTWNGFEMYVDGQNKIVVPKKAKDGKPWVWRARFLDMSLNLT